MPVVIALDPAFEDHLEALRTTSAAAADASCMSGQRQWMHPPLNAWDGNPLNIPDITGAFDRAALNATYADIMGTEHGEGSVGEVMVVKTQLDYVAAMERAFRTRHMSPVRAKMHAAARRNGHADTDGLYNGSIRPWLLRLLEASHPPA